MKKYLLITCALGAAALTSCQDEDFGYKSNEIAYNKAMTELLGTVDPNQDWINAEQGYVIVNSDEDNVKVFDGMTHRVIADYDFVKAGDKIYYNNTIGYKPFISNGVQMMAIEAGQPVAFAAAPQADITVTTTSNTKEFTYNEIKAIETTLPEDKDNTKKGGVNTNFEFTGIAQPVNGMVTFNLYALYWNTNANLQVGLYYYDPATGVLTNGPVVYENKKGNKTLEGQYLGWHVIGDEKDSRRWGSTDLSNYANFRSAAIKISVPENVIFGFYVQQTDKDGLHRFYSNPELNTNCPKEEKCKGCHAGSFTFRLNNKFKEGAVCLGFEDWDNSVSDLNDIVFMLEDVQLFDYSTDYYTLAFEDLGATNINDIDFNDCVLQLYATTGKVNANVRLMASGGRYPIEVSYNGNSLWSETHAALGCDLVPVNANQYYQGVTKDVVSASPVAMAITLPSTDWNIKNVVKQFGLKVTREDGTFTEIHTPFDGGEYPYGFAIKGEFKWPGEQQRITSVYEDFATWATTPSKNTWYPWEVSSIDVPFTDEDNDGDNSSKSAAQ